jgi:3-phenylpropionate/trans-cinnamate dioxygenase ferredoxin subunit
MAEFRTVALITQLREGEVLGVELDDRKIALYLLGGEVVATTDVCPHAECQLSEYGLVDEEEIECSCHGSRFSIHSGANTGPPAQDPLDVYPVQVSGENVMVEIG